MSRPDNLDALIAARDAADRRLERATSHRDHEAALAAANHAQRRIMARRDSLGALPFTDYADSDPHGHLRIGDVHQECADDVCACGGALPCAEDGEPL